MVRILLADDHEIVRRGLRSLIETRDGWDICGEAANGLQAVERAIETRPDVAILDYFMPELNGLDVARQILPVLPKLQVLIFSEHDGETLIRDALQAGARGFLLKSDAEDQLLNAISTLALARPYFTARVSEAMLSSLVGQGEPSVKLTPRERETVQYIAEGLSNKGIAWRLQVSVKTIETHRATAMRKLGMRSMAELVRYAVRTKLIEA
ncbi:response regulator transcription factor [Phreatobacter stygius]|uniref:Response regulator transcription factor n=2 Tax=Phreatobacter stygius TaxID=1940610 RepID=A0A4D7B7X6_9HYPH|nr:response regulator transcription factor [Phreatobacter stygius]QCI69191.1 response regulator transcription factor [Phreatobacter stygius]